MTPRPEHVVAFVPIAHFAAARDDVKVGDLGDVLVLLEDWHQPRLLAPSEPAYRATLERMWRASSFGSPNP